MTRVLTHRGPDDGGVWADPQALVALGHRRLSILDLSPEGRQPMLSASDRYVISYNGEVYNYIEIRKRLKEVGQAPAFRGHSDTEVMLAAIETWGLEKAVSEFNGIFAFALWDRKEHELSLVRDRVGVKPLYYGWAGTSFVFGSELKALKKHRHFNNAIDRGALALYFRHNYIPAPYSIYEKTFKLLPGHILKIRSTETHFDKSQPLHSTAYWSAQDVWLHGAANQWQGNEDEAIDTLENLLRDVVGSQMISDVPLGAFLSGGIDSSIVTAFMQSQSSRPVKTFSIGFCESGYNEAVYAKQIAGFLGTDHTELYVTDKEARDVIPLIPTMYDEPFADSSQIPTYIVSKLAREQVTVSLSGDGGDELFGGYSRYMLAEKLWTNLTRFPTTFKKLIAITIDCLPIKTLDILGYPLNPMLKTFGYLSKPIGDRLKKYSSLLSLDSRRQVYQSIICSTNMTDCLSICSETPDVDSTREEVETDTLDYCQLMTLLDFSTYLPDDILVKVDRASMAVALETRVPILDHGVVDFASTLPSHMKIRGSTGKFILKKLLKRYIPVDLTKRPKQGFGVPVAEWLRGPLKEWAADLLESTRLNPQGFVNHKKVTNVWGEHCSYSRDWSGLLWPVLILLSWLKTK